MKKNIFNIYRYFRNLKKRTKVLLLGLFIALIWFWLCLPQRLFNAPVSWVIKDAKGQLLGATIAADGQWRFPYSADVPDKFAQCIVTFEDKRFYFHPGVDILAMMRAIRQNFSASHTISGGSTITMQVMRMSRNRPRNIFQKIIESIQAIRLELSFSKKEILALYASNAPFGSNVIGLDAASWRYYARPPERLSWGEMAALAVLPNAPALVHPGKNRNILLKKRNLLLDKLLQQKKIDTITHDLALLEALPDEPKPLPQLAPHLLQRFRTEFKSKDKTIAHTTINTLLQQNVTRIIEQYQAVYRGNSINNICALVLEVESGKVLSYVGNIYHPEDPGVQSHVDIINSARSPGSTLKPLLYACMLHEGRFLPGTLIADIPTQIGGYTPQNYDRDYEGAVPAHLALSRSLNIPAVRMLRDYKYPRFYEVLQQLGITTLNQPADHYGLSLILGGCEVTPWDLAAVYAGMARALNHTRRNKDKILKTDFSPPVYLSDAMKKNNNDKTEINFLDPVAIWQMFQAMEDVMRPGEEGLWKQFSSSQRVAWKTGTSFGFRDAWAVGITPRFVTVVWVGNGTGEGRPGLIGVQKAAPVLFDIIRQLPASPWFSNPAEGLPKLAVCHQSGFRANTDCTDIDSIAVSAEESNSPLCPYHNIIHLDPSQQYRVTENCISPSLMVHKSWFILPPVMEWYYRQKHFDYLPLPPYKEGCGNNASRRAMALIYPENNARIYVPVEINGVQGKVIFTAAHQKPDAKIFWHLDDEYIGVTTRFHQVALSPAPGRHFLTIVDEVGERVTHQFEVLEKEKTPQ